jgi:hypothetical protein
MKSTTAKLYRIALLAGLVTVSSHADTLLTQVAAPNRNNFDGTIGIRFTVANTTAGVDNLLVTSLGFQDAGLNGLTTSHQVGLWRVSDSFLMASTVVSSGTAGTLVGAYRYGSDFAGVTLLEGVTYELGALVTNGGDSWTDSSAGLSMNPAATVVGDVYRSGTTFGFSNLDGGGDNLRWAPANMQFTAVPEPSTYGMMGAGALAAVAFVRRRRKLAGIGKTV